MNIGAGSYVVYKGEPCIVRYASDKQGELVLWRPPGAGIFYCNTLEISREEYEERLAMYMALEELRR